MRNALAHFTIPSFNLDPIAASLIDDLLMQIDQRSDSRVFVHELKYQRMIKIITQIVCGGRLPRAVGPRNDVFVRGGLPRAFGPRNDTLVGPRNDALVGP